MLVLTLTVVSIQHNHLEPWEITLVQESNFCSLRFSPLPSDSFAERSLPFYHSQWHGKGFIQLMQRQNSSLTTGSRTKASSHDPQSILDCEELCVERLGIHIWEVVPDVVVYSISGRRAFPVLMFFHDQHGDWSKPRIQNLSSEGDRDCIHHLVSW